MSQSTDENSQQVSYKEIVQLFRESDYPVLTARDLEDEFGFSNQAANYRLQKMVERETVVKRKVGGAAAVYWLKRD